VAEFLEVSEKMVYSLVAEKALPATKVTGKWLFPRHLVEQWIEAHTINYPSPDSRLPPYHGLLILAGSNDLLLDRVISHYNTLEPGHMAVFGNLGSMGGLRALRQGLCHMATSHLLQEADEDYNFEFAGRELERPPVIVNFCRREQGLLVGPNTAKRIRGIPDLGQEGVRIVNRPLGTGTRLLFDRELTAAGLRGEKIAGYVREVPRHMDVGLEILAGRAEAGPGIRPVAELLGIGFIPLRWERYDLLVTRERFFERGVQAFLALLHEPAFQSMSSELAGYDDSLSGRMIFPRNG
jgi:excisionase family DNA binding protein